MTLAEVLEHLKFDGGLEDATLQGMIRAAREWCEQYTGRRFMPRSVQAFLPAFADCIELGCYPASSIALATVSGGTPTAFTGFVVEPVAGIAFPLIRLAYGGTWPTLTGDDYVKVTATAGYADANAVPESVRMAMKLLIAHWFVNREAVVTDMTTDNVPLTVDALLQPLRLW